MDKKNLRIMSILNEDCRTSLTDLSKAILSSKQATSQRIKRLETEYIRSYRPITNIFRLGYTGAYLYLKIAGLKKKNLFKKLGNLKKLEEVSWIATLFGSFDVAIAFRYKNAYDLSSILNRIYSEFNKRIIGKEIFLSQKFIIPVLSMDDEKKGQRFFILESNHGKILVLNPIQKKILKELSYNARASYSKLSEKLGISSKTIKKKISELEKEGVILGYSAILDYPSLGFLWTSCILKTYPGTDISLLVEFLKKESRITWIAISVENEIMFDFLGKDFSSLKDFLNNLKINYDHEIIDYNLLNINVAHKANRAFS